jgi:hypothetical protein
MSVLYQQGVAIPNECNGDFATVGVVRKRLLEDVHNLFPAIDFTFCNPTCTVYGRFAIAILFSVSESRLQPLARALPRSVQVAFYGREAALRLAGPGTQEGVGRRRDRRVLPTTYFGELV